MLIHPWDAATSDDEWRSWLGRQQVGTLICPGRDREVPVVVPTHFSFRPGSSDMGVPDTVLPDTVLLHLARPNPVWAAIQERPRAVLSVDGDWAYVPAAWKAVGNEDPALGIPTSYYAAVVLDCTAQVLAGDELLEVLRHQLADFEPGSAVADPSVHGRRLPGIRGLRLTVTSVQAKFKYGGNADDAHRIRIAAELSARDLPGDAAARAHLVRRTPAT